MRSAGTPRKEPPGRGVSFSKGWPKVNREEWVKTPRCPVCGTCGASWVRRTSQELVCQKCGCVSKGKIIEGEGWRPLGYKE
ncbi:MAG: hypothetical protein DDT32_02167 [Syntrophomonadaceae bacterium]|nr:hypothetical protein [Bacillota bacterium]